MLVLYVLYTVFFLSCLVLIASVLLQPGKTDAGALFTSNISNTAFGPRGTVSILSRITIVAAGFFMVTALLISMPALQGNVSVLQSVTDLPAEAPAEQPAPPSDANPAPPANSDGPANR